MARRIKLDRKGQPVRDDNGRIIRTKPNTENGLMFVPACAEIEDNYLDRETEE